MINENNVNFCINALMNSREKTVPDKHSCIVASVFEKDGRYSTVYLQSDERNIAHFILADTNRNKEILFCSGSDYALFESHEMALYPAIVHSVETEDIKVFAEKVNEYIFQIVICGAERQSYREWNR